MCGVSLKVSAGDANLNSMQALFVICISFKVALCSFEEDIVIRRQTRFFYAND